MTVTIAELDLAELRRLISVSSRVKMTEYETKSFDACLFMSQNVWVGKVDGEIACIWGLIPPSLLSFQAYLWLYTNELVDQHQFLFVRHSHRMMEVMLKQYPTIVGFASRGNVRAIRWIKWLGGDFEMQDNKAVFRIGA